MKSYNHSCQIIAILAVAAITILFALPCDCPAQTIINPDADGFSHGTDISIAFTGVTLSSIGSGGDGHVYAYYNPSYASTGTNIFGGGSSNPQWYSGKRLQADFDYLSDRVTIDIIGNDSSDYGVLEAYNSSGILLASVTSPQLGHRQVFTAEIVRPSYDIAYIIASGLLGDTVYLDNLTIRVIIDTLGIEPTAGLVSSGNVGGPFVPQCQTYTLTNTSPNSLDWTATKTQSWLDVTPAGGTLGPGGSNTVDVCINASASFLPISVYTDTVTFSNLTSGIDQSRNVKLRVGFKTVLAFIQYADASQEYPNTLAAISSVGTNYTVTELTDYTQLDSMLPGHDVLLIPEQENASSSQLVSIGTTWSTTVQNFVNNGGVVIHCIHGDRYEIMTGSGLMNIISAQHFTGTVVVTAPSDPVAQGIPGSYDASNGSAYLNTPEGQVVVELTGFGPVVINKQMGLGNVALIGHDYFLSNADQDRIVGNAVFNLPTIQDDLFVTPPEDFNSSGYEKGPFVPSSKTYTLTNTGPNSLDWTATATQSWLNVTPTGGTLAGGAFTTVDVIINTDANALPFGNYIDTVTFTNTTSGIAQTRNVKLIVKETPPNQVIVINEVLCPQVIVPDAVKTLSGAITLTNLPGGGRLRWHLKEEPNSSVILSVDAPVLDVEPAVRIGQEDPSLKEDQPPLNPDDFGGESRGGPDAGGYTYIDSHEPGGPAFNWIEIASTGINLGLSDDTYYFPIDLSFAFNFYGTNYTQVAVCSNGTIYFENSYHSLSNVCIPATSPVNRFISLYWDDLYPSGTENVYYEIVGSAPNRILVVQFENVRHYGGSSTDRVTAQVQLFERGSEIMMLYEDPSLEAGSGATVGIQGDPTTGLNYSCNSAVLEPSLAILFSRGISWIEVAPTSGVLPSGQSIDLDVTFDSRGLPRVYTDQGLLIVESDDLNSPEEIQVCLEVRPDPLEIVPDANFVFSGHPGGPFVPSNASYQLTNNGPIDIDWTVDEPNWLDVHPSGGTLKPGYSTTVTVTPNSQADAKEEGSYNGQLLFTDITTTVEQIRNVILNVHTAPKIWAKPSSLDITIPYGETATQILTIGNTGDSALNFTLSSRQTNFTPPPEQQPVATGAGEASDIIVSIPPEHDFTVVADVPYAVGQLLVRFAPIDDVNEPNLAQEEAILAGLTEAYGASIERDYEIVPGLSLVTLPEGVTVEEALLEFNNTEGILYAQPNYEVKIDLAFPNDIRFNDLWGMHNIGQTGGTPDADIDAPEAWDIGTGSSQIIIAVIDTGVDYTHPDLAANMWVNEAELNGTPGVDDDGNGYVDDIYGYDFRNNDGDPMDDRYHGTHCAGTIGAVGNNGIGVAGVCWNVRIMAVKFLSSGGTGTTADAISSIEYSILMGANLSSNSWGGGPYEQALKDAIDAAGAAGMLFVASAGNDYGSNNDTYPHYPSSYDSNSVVAVLATDKYDSMSYFSNYGLTSVDIGAPGSEILSCEPGNRYQYLNGTSMAAPHVSGACALLWSMNPFLSNENVKNILTDTVDGTLPGLCVSGGRLNLYNAILETGTQWIGFEPEFGTVAVDSTNDVNVVFNGEQPPGTYQGHISILSDDPYTPELTIPVTMTVETIDYFTELFDPNGNDMANKTLTFRPDASGSYYQLCINEANGFPVDPNGGTVISLDDDDYEQVILDDAYINFYGTKYSTFYIGSNGYISFVFGDIYYLESFADHFNLPRISALFDDLDPSAGGLISWKQFDDRVVVTFENVPEYSLSKSNSFQIEMRFNGKIRITFLEIEAEDGLVGLSEGNDVPVYFIESNLSEYGVCSFLGDLNGDQDVDLTDYAIFASYWQMLYEDTIETVRDEFNAISFGGNDGTQYFSYDWQEIGESDGPSKGRVVVAPTGESNALWLGRKKENCGASREVDLSGSTFATLTFDWQRDGLYYGNDTTVDISSDGGGAWTTLLNIPDGDETSLHSESFDISSFIAPDTQVRFITNEKGDGYIYFDNIQIEYGGGVYEESWCGKCDFYPDLVINGNDLLIFTQCWLN